MRLSKCDVCEKEVKYENMVQAKVGLWSQADLCKNCGAPVIKLLKKHKFLEDFKLEETGKS